ncbi:MAG: SMC family ATPase [Oscillospiraceae bacterium]|nr:SMC family ATPase [Oscillospiraceae bacterium]
MRPLKLTISAFGSYLDETVIDFEKLGEKGIYLITGDTGAGKTTIFDAVTYALYGTGSGDFRNNAKNFRSMYATSYHETFVELEFLYRDEVYVIRRNPEYERAAKRGEGTATESASELLITPDGRNITGKVNVNEEIKKIVGVDERQFRQIVMLPQGSFMKFLMADTSEKRKIFAEIFKTHLYEQLQEKVKETAKITADEIDDDKKIISRSIKEIICPETSQAYEFIAGLAELQNENDAFSADIISEKIDLINSEQTEMQTECEKLRNAIDRELEEINKNLGIQKVNHELKVIIEKNKEIISAKTSVLEQLRVKLEQAQKNAQQVKQLEIRTAEIEKQYPEYAEKDKLTKEHKKVEKEYTSLEKKRDKLISETENETLLLEKYKNEIKNLEVSETAEIDLNKQLDSLERQLEKIDGISDMTADYDDAEANHKTAQKKFTKTLADYEKERDEYQKKESLYDSAIAGILAEKLSENQMCPVCGSKEHPCIAVKPADTPSEQELEKCKKHLDVSKEKKDKSRDEVNSLNEKLNILQENIRKASETLWNQASDTVEEIAEKSVSEKKLTEERVSDVKKQLDDIKKRKTRIKEIESLTKISEAKIKSSNEAVEKINAETSQLKEKLVILKTRIDGIVLEFENMESAKAECVKLSKQIDNLNRTLAEVQTEHDACITDINTAKSALETAESQLETTDIPETEELNLMRDEKSKKRNEIIEQITSIRHITETNISKKKSISEYAKKLEKNYEKYRWQKELSDLVNGNIKKQNAMQMTLEVRVQMIYFARIINKANIRLLKMTNGQYELVRAEESSDKRRKFGLDLNIYDHYTQSEREVKTLSGGESFITSLALAFGMADEIQQSAGGIKIDTMFIDEGFGSLDDEALGQAVNMLASLVEGNRLIGIISHVSELKNQIDKKIIVTKNNYSGSKVKIEY